MLHRLPHDLLFRFHSPQHDGKERETKSWNSDCISIENNISSVQIKLSLSRRWMLLLLLGLTQIGADREVGLILLKHMNQKGPRKS
ncbi:uncharacterized protein LOC116106385 isoform X3 [Pistacia vera]|uniref:uncharacterized protein LOC116106385 isoform X3 n=1 Tax=Pistacia vera TaxID=55513 RepID=UPI001263E085|nr:uncharacterized protein LOC116106385 isoform X3 [Pistacia vera]XP_031248607.1 uncharacterized protein LOC116106385 isoform X3 [Pistacia vera]